MIYDRVRVGVLPAGGRLACLDLIQAQCLYQGELGEPVTGPLEHFQGLFLQVPQRHWPVVNMPVAVVGRVFETLGERDLLGDCQPAAVRFSGLQKAQPFRRNSFACRYDDPGPCWTASASIEAMSSGASHALT